MRRIALLAALAATTMLAAPAASHAFATGIGDQRASMFSSPYFDALKMRQIRYIVSYDVMSHRQERADVDAWFAAAKAKKSKVLVAFNHSRFGNKKKAPSRKAYRKAVTRFHKKYGKQVSAYQPWNEVNACPSQPKKLCRGSSGAKRAAGYYKELRRVTKGKKTIVALDLLDTDYKGAAKYMRHFVRHAKPLKPRLFGLHNYSDTNRNSMKRTSYILRRMPKGSKMWLTETGGLAQFGGFKYDLKRQAKSVRQMFKIARKYKKITRVYLYNFTGFTNTDQPDSRGKRRPFDAGLIGPDGLPRPAYDVARKRGK